MTYEEFEQEFESLTGICLRLYKEKQMKRRINTLIGRKGLVGYEIFLSQLKTDPVLLAEFTDYITINVTEFFRTPEHWNGMETEALSDLAGRKEEIRIWSTACATGEEPYSLAMSLLERTDPSRFHILATDINEKVLRSAAEGRYSEKMTEKLPEDIAARFFIKGRDGSMQLTETVKSCVEFRKLDLLKDSYPENCDMIVCRNVLIYFTEEAKDRIWTKFSQSLKQGGWLFTGNTEQIIYYKKYGLKKITGFLYRKI